jgi:hypothetical protein
MPSEPDTMASAKMLNEPTFCPVVLNNYLFNTGEQTVPLWYRYMDLTRVFRRSSISQKWKSDQIFVYRHYADASDIISYLKERGYNITGDGSPLYREYFNTLATAKYLIVPYVSRKSSGQIVADAASFGVPTFGYSHRGLQRLLMPPFLLWRTEDELFEKLETLEQNYEMYETAVNNIMDRTQRYLSIQSLPTLEQIISFIQTISNDTRCYSLQPL